MTILGQLAESFKTVNRPDPTVTFFDGGLFFSKSIKDRDLKFQHNLHSSLQFILIKLGIDIFR